ncbi:MAG: SMP-30/gluconolactonase/LRE family protein [Rhodospirillales bacterium]|nr:SMP-30/gluconolactonase/LRE family protein [Rhodospirillales bacterium]
MYAAPPVIKSEVVTIVPAKLRNKGPSSWGTQVQGRLVDCFLEGPSFDHEGNLFVVDIPNGRIMMVTPARHWNVIVEYDGWPNGLKLHKDGRAFITDRKRGLLVLHPKTGKIEPLVENFRGEAFRGLNDLVFAKNGDCYFTDFGDTGWQDPTGRVFRLTAAGRLEVMIDTGLGPNGIVLAHDDVQILVGMGRNNSIWRMPMKLGWPSRVNTFIQMSGGSSGPDGMAMDVEGGLIVAHPGTGVWRFDSMGRPTHFIESAAGRTCTNVAFGGPENRDLYITEAESGTILRAQMPIAGRPMFSHQS